MNSWNAFNVSSGCLSGSKNSCWLASLEYIFLMLTGHKTH
jgi:hypothetical protein